MTHKAQPVELRQLDWDRMRMKLIWAYEGPPAERDFAGVEFQACTVWLILKGHVIAVSPTQGRIQVRAGHWLFPVMDKNEHHFSRDAQIISMRVLVNWPNHQMLYKHDQWITFPDQQFPNLKRAAQGLTRICLQSLHITPSLPFLEEGILKHSCTLPRYIQLQQAVFKWVNAYHHCMQQMGIPLNLHFVTDERVNDCMRFIEQNACQGPYDSKELEHHAGLSISQLNRLFVARMGLTPKAYAQMQRLNYACTMLISSSMPIKQLAYNMAFKAPAHFTNWFRSSTGITPKDYRKNNFTASIRQLWQILDMQ